MASKNVPFEKIGSSIRKPGVYAEFNTRMAVRSLPGNLQRLLLVGQKTADSTGAALQVTDVFSDDEAATKFGIGSQVHRMVLAALTANPYAQLSVVALDDPAGAVAAVWKLTITGTPTDAGTLYLGLAGDTVSVNVNATDTPATVAAAFATAIAAKPKLPFIASSAAGVLSVTAKNKGGHSSVPRPDNAIYELAGGVARFSKYSFPVKLNSVTRVFFERTAAVESAELGAAMRASAPDLRSPPAALMIGLGLAKYLVYIALYGATSGSNGPTENNEAMER
jgi:hypothetical protein